MEIQLADDGTPPNINCAPRPKDLRFVFDACVCACICVFIVQRCAETEITKRICFRLQSTNGSKMSTPPPVCSCVCVFLYLCTYT